MKSKGLKLVTTIALLGTMLFAMGMIVFGYANKNTINYNVRIRTGETTGLSNVYKCNAAGNCPGTLSWTDVNTQGRMLFNTYQYKKVLWFYKNNLWEQKYTTTLKASNSSQTLQIQWQKGVDFRFEFMGQDNVNAKLTNFVFYYN